MLLVFLLYALLASTFTFGKIALTYFQPFFFIGIRMVLGGLLLLGYVRLFKRHKFSLQYKSRWLFMQAVFFHIYAAFMLEFWALQYLTSSKACLLYNTSPFLAALFSYIMFGEQMTIKKGIGLLIGCAGFLPILLSESPQEVQEGLFGWFSWAEIALLGSVIVSVYGWMVVRKLVKHEGYSPFMVNGVAMLGGGVLALLTSMLVESQKILATSVMGIMQGLGYTVLMILIANVMYYNLYGYLLRIYSPTWLAFAGFMCPLFAALYGWILLGEQVTASFFMTLGIVICGLYLFYQEELRQGYGVSK